jgi:hypothetical protein
MRHFGAGPSVTIHIALVPYKISLGAGTLTQVAAALQRQVVEDFAPVWHVDATVSAFVDWNSVPADYVRLILVNQLDSGALGVHADRNGQTYALVAAQGDWPLVASHECLELLADPTGRKTCSGPSPRGDGSTVEFLLEVCDPCQGRRWSYELDGIPVSEFCTPAFYEGSGAPGERWSHRGSITGGPRVVAKDGYLIWHEPGTGEWWRRDHLGATPTDYALGPIPPDVSCLRGHIDRVVRSQRRPRRKPAARRFAPRTSAAAKARTKALEATLRSVLANQARKRTT